MAGTSWAASTAPTSIGAAGGQAAPGVTPVRGLSDRLDPAVAVSRGSVFVFGGSAPSRARGSSIRFLSDGALLKPGSSKAKRVSSSPFRAPLKDPVAVSVGDQVMVLGTACKSSAPPEGDTVRCRPGTLAAAVYDAKRDSWRNVAPPSAISTTADASAEALGATADGRAVIRLGTTGQLTYWTYDVAARKWVQLADPNAAGNACVAGNDLMIVTSQPAVGGGWTDPAFTSLDLRQGTAWQSSSTAPDAHYQHFPPSLLCLDGAAAVVDTTFPATGIRTYDTAARTWTKVPDGPSAHTFRTLVAGGDHLLLLPGETHVGEPGLDYDTTTSTWSELAGLPPVTLDAQWSANSIVGYAQPIATYRQADQASPTGNAPPPGQTVPPPPRPTIFTPGVFEYRLP